MADSSIDDEQVRRVARLAALHLTDAEVSSTARQLGAILGHMQELARVDTDGIPPTFHSVPPDSPLRVDEVAPAGDRDSYLAAAPRSEAGAFAVPKVLDGGG